MNPASISVEEELVSSPHHMLSKNSLSVSSPSSI